MSLDALKEAVRESGLAEDDVTFGGDGPEVDCILCERGCMWPCMYGCPLGWQC